jgi:hypothetical protein
VRTLANHPKGRFAWTNHIYFQITSVPDPSNPYVFGPPGSALESVSHKVGFGYFPFIKVLTEIMVAKSNFNTKIFLLKFEFESSNIIFYFEAFTENFIY